jgi:hypothetical protein
MSARGGYPEIKPALFLQLGLIFGGGMTTPFSRTESAKWALESQKVVGELQDGVEKALSEAASRGFPAAPGVTLAAILAASQDAKGKLTEANGKIYEDRRGVIFQEEEFLIKTIVQVARLAMEMYRAELLNALEIEQAQNLALRDQGLADVARQTSEVEGRQAAIIMGRAEAERQVIGFKVALANAERQTMESEVALANAQLATATKKLEIIDSIYQVLAAEELVLAAERQRAAAEEQVLAAKRELAEVKQGMVVFYQEKASAKTALSRAIAAEVPDKIALEMLGYDRAALKTASGEVEHGVRMAEMILEVSRARLAKATAAVELARAQSQTAIAEFSNAAQASINASRSSAGMTQISTHVATQLGHAAIEVNNGVAVAQHEATLLSSELRSILANLASRASNEATKVSASANQGRVTDMTHLISRKIVEGAF